MIQKPHILALVQQQVVEPEKDGKTNSQNQETKLYAEIVK
jgi:hypothetical protein